MKNNTNSISSTDTTSEATSIAPTSETPFASAPNKEHWDGVMGPHRFERMEEFQTLYLKLAGAIKRAVPEIIASNAGIKLHHADSVLEEIKKDQYDLHFDVDEAFVGDCLGCRGLCLPSIEVDDVVYYALHLVDATATERELFQNQLNQLPDNERSRLLLV